MFFDTLSYLRKESMRFPMPAVGLSVVLQDSSEDNRVPTPPPCTLPKRESSTEPEKAANSFVATSESSCTPPMIRPVAGADWEGLRAVSSSELAWVTPEGSGHGCAMAGELVSPK